MQETRAFNGSTREETGAATGSSRTNIFSGKASEALLLAMLFSPHNSIWKATALQIELCGEKSMASSNASEAFLPTQLYLEGNCSTQTSEVASATRPFSSST